MTSSSRIAAGRHALTFIFCGLLSTAGWAQDLVLTEFLASNGGGLRDAEGASPDWMEVCNTGDTTVDTDGWWLTDDPNLPSKWRLPSRVLSPGECIVIFASGKDRAGSELHANFELDADGEFLALTRPNGEFGQTFAPRYPPQRENISYGVGEIVEGGNELPATLRWFVPGDESLGDAWKLPEFDDAAWSGGDAAGESFPLGFDSDPGGGVSLYAALVRSTPGLVGYWRLGEAPGSPNAADETGAHVGTYAGEHTLDAGGAVVGDSDTAVDLAGGTIDVPAHPALDMDDGPMTLELWVAPAADDSFQWFVSKGPSSSSVDFLVGATSSGTFRFLSQGLTNVVSSPTNYAFDSETWYHLVVVQDPGSSQVRLYVNGELVAAEAFTNGSASLGTPLRLGDRTFGSSQALHGRLDEVSLYDVALRSEDIQQHYDAAREPAGFQQLLQTDVSDQMAGQNASLYARYAFDLTSTDLSFAVLQIRYEDGFAAFLNGVEVAARNTPATLSWNSVASTDRGVLDALVVESIDLADHISELQTGRNVLALQALNSAVDSSDFFLDVSLETRGSLQLAYFPEPTPGDVNGQGVVGLVERPAPSHPRGVYDAGFDLELTTAPSDAQIRYTLDGSAPTAVSGTLYSGAVRISGTSTLRAIATKSGHLSSPVVTYTYVFFDDVLAQTGAGFPSTWNGTTPDYAMDPNVVNAPRYAATLRDDLRAIPSLSVVMPVADLFGSAGVYSNPTQRGDAWERECSVELFDPQSSEEFQINAGLRAHGGSSRSPDITPQHSLRLHFRSEYGAARLRHRLFRDSEIDSFDALVISANSSDNWTSANLSTGVVGQFIRDQWAHDVQRDMGHEWVSGRFVHLYLNGLYWGLYVLQERIDAAFAESHYGGREDEYDVVVDRSAFRGNLTAWSQLLAAARNRDMGTVETLLDVDGFIDYMLVQMFTGNWDWPDHNWHAIRRRTADGRFRFPIWDAEVGLGLAANIPGPIRPGLLTLDLTGSRPDVSSSAIANGPGEIYDVLRPDPEFRIRFADRLQRHLRSNGALTPAHAADLYETRATEIAGPLTGEAARWGDVRREPPSVPDGRWQKEREWIVGTFFPNRPEIVLNQFRNRGLYPDIDAPSFGRPSGRVLTGFRFSLDAPEGVVYFARDGVDPRLPGGGIHPQAETVSGGVSEILLPEGATAAVLVPTDDVLGLSWTGLVFNDAAWIHGATGVGFETGSGYEDLIATDVEAQAYEANATVYVRIVFDVDEVDSLTALTLRMKYDDGFIAYLNGVRVAEANAPEEPDWDSIATGSHADSDARIFESFDITDHLEVLRAGSNVLALHALNRTINSGDLLILPQLRATRQQDGANLSVDGPTRLSARALDGSTWSALSEAFYFPDVPLRISEIHYHPREPDPDSDFSDDDFEFVELYHAGDEPMDLAGFRLSGGIEFDFSGGGFVLEPGDVLLVVRRLDAFLERYPFLGATIAGEYSGRLDNLGDTLRLEGAGGEPLLDFAYSDTWLPETDGEGHSLVVADVSAPPDSWGDAASWQASLDIDGSPGTITEPTGGRQFIGNLNQDSAVDISDAVSLLSALFLGDASLPCEGESIATGGNLPLADFNGDVAVDLTDAVSLLNYLFLSGSPPALGVNCVRIEGCPERCGG